VVDRLFGMLVLVPFGAVIVVVRRQWFNQTPVAQGLYWFLIVFMTVLTVFFATAFLVTRLRWTKRLPRWWTRRKWLMWLVDACALFGRSWRESFVAYALSFPVLFGTFAPFYCAARAFNAPVSLWDIFSIMPIVLVVTSVPISFSGIGVREQLFKNLLADLTGISASMAVLISLTGFLSYVSWSLAGAVIYLFSKPARGGKAKARGR
jgi:uncharacterized membrane protein YbhN (UPF0104 family)